MLFVSAGIANSDRRESANQGSVTAMDFETGASP